MRTEIITALFLISLISAASAAETAICKPDTILKAISIIERDPTGPLTKDAMAAVVNFADESDAVQVEIDVEFTPWVDDKKDFKNGDILLAALVAGNIRPQLEQKVAVDHPAEGLQFMLKVYRKLRKSGKIEKVPQLEEWLKLDFQGIKKLIEQNKSAEPSKK